MRRRVATDGTARAQPGRGGAFGTVGLSSSRLSSQSIVSDTKCDAAVLPSAHAMAAMSFWGAVIKPGKPTPLKRDQPDASIVLKQAALSADASKASGASVLSVSVGPKQSEKFVLCHLTPGTCDQWSLDIGFAPEDGEVTFHLSGKNSVHLTGFTELDDDDEDDDMMDGQEEEEEEEDDEEDDEEVVVKGDAKGAGAAKSSKAAVLKGTAAAAAAAVAKGSSKKAPPAPAEDDEDDDDEEDDDEEDDEEEGEEEERRRRRRRRWSRRSRRRRR